MYNNSEKISANEINKFCYCPYQWYYERLYGAKNLRNIKNQKIKISQKAKTSQKNQTFILKNEIENRFKKGLKFHNNYRLKRTLILFLKIIILIFIFVFIGYFMMVKM